MQKRNSIMRAFSFSSGSNISQMEHLNKSRSLADKTAMAVYFENVLLPKHVTHSFYATWLNCYEELFEASLSGKSSHIKFDSVANPGRKDSEKLSLEKATLCGISLDCDLNGKYTQKETVHYEEEVGQGIKDKEPSTCRTEEGSVEGLKSSYTSAKLFAGRKKTYRFSYNGDL